MENLPPPPLDVGIQTRYDDPDNDTYYEENLDIGYMNPEGDGQTGTELYNINTEELYNHNNNNNMAIGVPINNQPMSPSVVNGNRGLLSIKNNNNHNIGNHKLDTMSEQLNTLVQLQSMKKNNKDAMRESELIKVQQQHQRQGNGKFWILWNVILFILLLFTFAVNLHYMLYRMPCKRVLKKDQNELLVNADALNVISTAPTIVPTYEPSITPSYNPSMVPTDGPTKIPSMTPSNIPSNMPSITPTKTPSMTPSEIPSNNPSITPTINPSTNPTEKPTNRPTSSPSYQISTENILPIGSIVIYADCSNIPTGWELCDGSGTCPDLRGKLVVGGGNGYNYGDTANTATHTHGYSASGTSGSHTLTVNQLPAHNHHSGNFKYLLESNCDRTYWWFPDETCGEPNLLQQGEQLSIGGGQSHSHGWSINSITDSSSHMPPYFALCFIMKIQEQTWNAYP